VQIASPAAAVVPQDELEKDYVLPSLAQTTDTVNNHRQPINLNGPLDQEADLSSLCPNDRNMNLSMVKNKALK